MKDMKRKKDRMRHSLASTVNVVTVRIGWG